MDTEQKLEKLNKKVKSLFDLYDIDFSDPTEPTHEMKFALARLYADDGVRKFLENMIKKAERDGRSAITVYEIAVNKERINVLLQLLSTSRSLFHESLTLERGIKEYATDQKG